MRALCGLLLLTSLAGPALAQGTKRPEDPKTEDREDEGFELGEDAFGFEPEEAPPARGRITYPQPFDPQGLQVEEGARFELHGRFNLDLQFADPDDPAEGLDEFDWAMSGVTLFGIVRLTDWLQFLTEVETELETENGEFEQLEVESDLAAFELHFGPHIPTFRLGLSYVPFGIERRWYAPPRNLFANRPLAFRKVYPGTYSDVGAFVLGELQLAWLPRLVYEGCLVVGLDGPEVTDRPEYEFTDANPLEHRSATPLGSGRLGVVLYENVDDPGRLPLRLEFGGSALLTAFGDGPQRRLELYGLDLALRIGAFEAAAEFIAGTVEEPGRTRRRDGGYVWVAWREELDLAWAQAVYVGARFGAVDPDDERRDRGDLERYSAVLGWEPAPGFRFKLQYDRIHEVRQGFRERPHIVTVQLGYAF